MFDLTALLNFYRDAYQYEYSTERVADFFAKNVSNLYYPESFELLIQDDYQLPVASDWGRKVTAELELNSSEKKLVAGTFFIKGKAEVLGKTQRIFAPLFLHDVNLDRDVELYSIQLDAASLNLNPAAFNFLNDQFSDIDISYDEVIEAIFSEAETFSFDGIVNLVRILSTKFPLLDSSLLNERIKTDRRLVNLEEVYKSRSKDYEGLLLPDTAIGLVDKPLKSRGVINELTELGKAIELPGTLLTKVFDGQTSKGKSVSHRKIDHPIIVPVSLSRNQRNIIGAADKLPLTVVIGPPGTGKSFTIGTLAVQAAHAGKKVLIASKNEQACQVIKDKIEQDIGIRNITVDASKPRYRISVAARLRNIANGVGVHQYNPERCANLGREVHLLKAELSRLTEELTHHTAREVNWAKFLVHEQDNILVRITKGWKRFRYSGDAPVWELHHKIERKRKLLLKKGRRYITANYQNELNRLLQNNRADLLRLEKAFQVRRGNVIKEIFSSVDYGTVLTAFPVWICKSTNVADIIPLRSELFDLLIIDEASQCDIASSLPLLYRAKAAVVVGDPNQLRHLSFLSKRIEQGIREKYGLAGMDISYRNRSILDQANMAVSSQEGVTFLDEHFRSRPDIIAFSNQKFYGNQLKVMTNNPFRQDGPNLFFHRLGGKRDEQGRNIREANEIVMAVRTIILEEAATARVEATGIGVISPFRGQVDLLKQLLKEELEAADLQKHKLLVGTPFSFQGEERDIVFLSFTVDDRTHGATYRYLDRANVFNVSITRAKRAQHVYFSTAVTSMPEQTLLADYLSYRSADSLLTTRSVREDHNFLREVGALLEELAAGTIYTDQEIAGVHLHYVITRGERMYGVNLIGYLEEENTALSLEQIRRLTRAGIDTFVLPFRMWQINLKACRNNLKTFLEN